MRVILASAMVCVLFIRPVTGEGLTFEKDVAPILKTYCWKCHGGGGLANGLDLRRRDLLLSGGKSGPAIVPGSADQSPLYQKLKSGSMPPATTTEENVVYAPVATNDRQQEIIRRWINEGARSGYSPRGLNEEEDPALTVDDRQWWAFVPPALSPLPGIESFRSARAPVDHYLLQQLDKRQLTFSPEADPRELLVRLYLDLTGLPPAYENIKQYLDDPSPDRYERKVDELLASPAFGQHWAQHWLDGAGYSDIVGVDNDGPIIKLHEERWRYRDYVISAFNEGLAYDQFLLEQLAGDELSDWRTAPRYDDTIRRQLVATGYLRHAGDSTGEKELNTADIRNKVLLDTVQMVSSSLMGVTLHCAQCHTHKFDPISQADYFRFAAIFAPGLNRQAWLPPAKRHLWSASPQERKRIDASRAERDGVIKASESRIQGLLDHARQQVIASRLGNVPEDVQADLRRAVGLAVDKRNPVEKYLAERLGSLLAVGENEARASVPVAKRQELTDLETKIAETRASMEGYHRIQAFWDISKPPRFFLFERGEFEKPGPVVTPGFVRVMQPPEAPVSIPGREGGGGGFRLALAKWLVNPEHPLTARVYVNRVWQRYFSMGIVSTPDNFGLSGAEPTHPALLDRLALELVRSGWDMKQLHRSIVRSAAYRQTSAPVDRERVTQGLQKDSGNSLLWKMPLRRLESGVIRDRILFASGHLNQRVGGPPVPLQPLPDGKVVIDVKKLSSTGEEFRRSIFVLARRNYHLTQLNVFDQPVLAHNCTRRNSSAGVAQSLAMFNSDFVRKHAGLVAARILGGAKAENRKQLVERAFQAILQRPPVVGELTDATEFLGLAEGNGRLEKIRSQLTDLCHVLLNTSEFIYAH